MPHQRHKLEFPPAPAVNKHAEETHCASLQWAREHDLISPDKIQQWDDARIGWIAARTNPHLPQEALRLVNDWYLWLFAVDDGYIDQPAQPLAPAQMVQLASHLSCIVLDPDFPLTGAGRCATGLRDVRRRIATVASPAQTARWVEAVHGYLMAICWEVANQATGTRPGRAEYTAMRRPASAVWSAFYLMDISAGYELQHSQLVDPRFRELANVAVDLISWDNDYYSHFKEVQETGARHNIIRILAEEQDCDITEAMHRYVELHDQHVDRFFDLEARLASRVTPEGSRFIEGIKHWIRASIDFQATSSRYMIRSTGDAV
ncbi:hypothetical protein ABZ442_31090 [Streptomyces triculaminicus]|uniref:terpene synthase family protein n=1 Tax=Streptomyces triculaminicus TaxID=2816232 RepID=UPI0033C03E15